MDQSFEKLVRETEDTLIFKPTLKDHDRPKYDRNDEHQQKEDKEAKTFEQRQTEAGIRDSGPDAIKPPYLRVIEVSKLTTSTAPPEMYYPEPKSKETIAEHRKVRLAIAVAFCTMIYLFYLINSAQQGANPNSPIPTA